MSGFGEMRKCKMKLALFKDNRIEPVEVKDELQEYYDLIECDCIEIVARRIGDTYFDIICDEEGLLKDNPRVSAVDTDGCPMFVGNLIFSHISDEGETESVTDEEIELIRENTGIAFTEDGRIVGMVVELDY